MPNIHRVKSISNKEILHYLNLGEPIIITGMVPEWDAFKQWDFKYFKDNFGTDIVTVNGGFLEKLLEMPLSIFIDSIIPMDFGDIYKHKGHTPYVQDWRVFELHLEMKKQIPDLPWFFNWERAYAVPLGLKYNGLPYSDITMLLGPAGATTYLHIDNCHTHAWSAQIAGRKHWTLFPPEQTPLIYNENPAPGIQPYVNIHNPNLEHFPQYAEATPIEIVSEPGDLFILPNDWWHQVTSLEPSISASGAWVNQVNFLPFAKCKMSNYMAKFKKNKLLTPDFIAPYHKLTKTLDNATLNTTFDSVVIEGQWQNHLIKITSTIDGLSITLSNYKHGRKFTSFVAESNTNLSLLELNKKGQKTIQSLLKYSSYSQLKITIGFTVANVTLIGPFNEEIESIFEDIMASLIYLTESLPSA